MGNQSDAYVRAALTQGRSLLYARLSEIARETAAHEMELARLISERVALAAQLDEIEACP